LSRGRKLSEFSRTFQCVTTELKVVHEKYRASEQKIIQNFLRRPVIFINFYKKAVQQAMDVPGKLKPA
jgi:hypothetical protein